MELANLLAELRRQGSDTTGVEVKSAHGGYPENLATTMSAFANSPGGGTIILGVDERGFRPVGVYDVALCQQAACASARNAVRPPVVVTTETESLDGADVVLVYVPEADRDSKPVRVIKSGQSYVRMYDGDYRLSEAEEQVLIAQRGHPRYDDQAVGAASPADLDPSAVNAYIAKRRGSSSRFTSMSDTEVLVRTGVLEPSGEHPTLAGLLALGVYPQQYFPSLAIQASLHDGTGGSRALDTAYLTGPIPSMMEECVSWIARMTPTSVEADKITGRVTDRPAYPPIALRELISNALIHRDLSPASVNQPVIVRVEQGVRLQIVSPGGLFGISVDGLGRSPSSLRNARLTEILQFVEYKGQRVVERIGSGIPAAQAALAECGMAPAQFDDRAVRFTVTVEAAVEGGGWAGVSLAQDRLLVELGRRPASVAQLAGRTGSTTSQVRYMLDKMTEAGLVVREPLDGRTFIYRLATATDNRRIQA